MGPRREHTHCCHNNKLIYKGDLTNGICDNGRNRQEGKPIKGTKNNYNVGGETCKHWMINKTFEH